MDFATKKDEILKTLDYWHMLDFASQEGEPEADSCVQFFPNRQSKKSDFGASDGDRRRSYDNKRNGNSSFVSVSQRKRLKLDKSNSSRTINSVINDDLKQEAQSGTEELHFTDTFIYLCSIDRELVLRALCGEKDSRVEKETDRISLGVIRFDSDWNYCGFELSHAIWLAKKNRYSGGFACGGNAGCIPKYQGYLDQYKKENEELSKAIGKIIGNQEVITIRDICGLVEKENALKPYCSFLSGICSEENGEKSRRQRVEKHTLLIDYKAYRNEDAANRNKREAHITSSFYSKEIESLIQSVNKAETEEAFNSGPLRLLVSYLDGGLGSESDHFSSRLDILSGDTDRGKLLHFYRDVLDLDNVPLGRWPSRYPLSFMQQTAVNLVAGRKRTEISFPANDVMSVNGPPGTGKTTLLKDIVAANIVEKARLLSGYKNPDEAFKCVADLSKRYLKNERAGSIYGFKDEHINDLGIIVCSSNNTAVENISMDLPDGKNLHSYFYEYLSEDDREQLLGEQYHQWEDWKKEGSGRDREAARDLYFSYAADKQFGSIYLSDYVTIDNSERIPGILLSARLGNAANRKQFANSSLRLVVESFDANGSTDDSLQRYEEARELFRSQLSKVEKLLFECSDAAKEVYEAEDRLTKLSEKIEDLSGKGAYGEGFVGSLLRRIGDRRKTRIEKQCKEIELLRQEARRRCSNCIEMDFVNSLCGQDDAAKKAHLGNPVLIESANSPKPDDCLAKERDRLFFYALRLTKEFILASDCMKSNLENLAALWNLKRPLNDGNKFDYCRFKDDDRLKATPALMQSLSVLTPVISSTFASVSRLFGDIRIGEQAPFGLLIIDEAGQAVPYAALGILSRCRRAVIVGDPSQIEPVTGSEVDYFREKLGKEVNEAFKIKSASVQKIADANNNYGHYRVNQGFKGQQWVGCPLVVHRRCISPMFDISNEISYGGSMINETQLPSEEKVKQFYKESSQWINIGGCKAGAKDYFVKQQGEEVATIVKAAFGSCNREAPSLFVISPFKTVVAGIRRSLEKPQSVSQGAWNKFLNNNIGTVHTFQGKEADEVVFVLGCDKSDSGAVRFVNANIVNVAASRAKYRLYIIGDYNVWERNDYIKAAKRELDVAWVAHWKKSQEYKSQGEIQEARQELDRAMALLPQGASIPTLSDDEDGAASKSNQEASEFVWDTTSYLNNVRDALGKACSFKNLLSDDDCKAFGFETLGDLESAFACCASGENNLVLDNIEQGIFFYKLLDGASERFDRSSGLIMFCRAAELYLRELLLPRLQEIAPHESSGKRNNQGHIIELGKLDKRQAGKFMLGAYKPIVEKSKVNLAKCYFAGAKTLNNEESGDRLSGDRLMCGGSDILEGKMDPAQAEWWGAFAGSLQGFSKKRNNVCHPGKSVQSTALLGFLFSSFWGSEQGKKVAIMEQSSVFEILKRGCLEIAAESDAAESELPLNERDALEGGGASLDEGEFAKAVETEKAEDELPQSLTRWNKEQEGALSELAKSIQLPGQWQTKLLDLLVMEGLLDDLGDRGRKATQKGQEFGITDRLFKEDGRPGKYNPEFSSEAIDRIKSNINDWTSQINKSISQNLYL